MCSVKPGWLILNDAVVVKEYVTCLNEYIESSVDNKKQERAINQWYKQWNQDREMRKQNGEHFYPFSINAYMDAIQEEQQLLEDIKLINENSINQIDDSR